MGSRWSLLSSPWFLGSILLLVVNDHVLKDAWPGLVTGKLSDVAGVAMVAIALTAVLGRPAPAAAATAVAFTLLKTVPDVAVWAEPVLGGRTRTDPSDLVALLVLVPVWHVATAPERPSGLRRSWDVSLRLVAVGVAVVATTATSCGEEGVATFAVAADGTIVADTYPTLVSRDGGRTWVEDDVEWPGPIEHRCFADGVCVTLDAAEGARLATTDGTTLLDIDAAEVRALDELDQPTCFAPVFGDVVVVESGGVEHVVVAMGWLGVLHAERGEPFEWVAVGPWGIQDEDASDRPLGLDVARSVPDAGDGVRLPGPVTTALMIGAWLLLPVSIAPLRRVARRKRRSATPVTVVTGVATLVFGMVGGGLLLLVAGFGATPSARTWIAVVYAASVVVALGAIWLVQGLVLARPRALNPPDAGNRVG